MLSASQSKMARTALGLGVRDLAQLADVSPNTIARLERGERLHERTRRYLRGALELQGAVFVSAGEISAWGGEGVRVGVAGNLSPLAALIKEFDSVTHLERSPDLGYVKLLSIFDRVLDLVKADDRDPDDWERFQLQSAVEALRRRWLNEALATLWLSITPPDNQARDYPLSPEVVTLLSICDLTYFRRAVIALRERGYVDRYVRT